LRRRYCSIFTAIGANNFKLTSVHFMYDEQGRLVGLSEKISDNAGKLIQETVRMNDLPIATIRPKGSNASTPLGITGTGAATANNLGTNTAANPVNVDFFYVHPDHLGTPRVVTKPADNKKVWEWQSQPFGEGAANENPQNLTGAALTAGQFRYNLRFPGQVYDAETAKHYNYFRDYDPSLGRYLESDPIGLRAGVNTFGYVYGNPIVYFDPDGLECVYSQGSGVLTCDNGLVCFGYSGKGRGRNNPKFENEKNSGPISAGGWEIEDQRRVGIDDPWRKSFPVKPIQSSVANRTGINIHLKDELGGPENRGCISVNEKCLDGIPRGETLRVTR
jgi:RHS repeat-associated protein